MLNTEDRHTVVLNKLQDAIKHKDSKIAAERRLTIERWVEAHRQVEYLEDDKLQFLYKIFQDEDSWLDTRLNNIRLGQKLTEGYKNGNSNIVYILDRYNIACRYCVVDEIQPLFQKELDLHRREAFPNADDNPTTNKHIRNDLLDSMKGDDPVSSFWINRESGGLKIYNDVDGFREAVKLQWSEGAEHFYNLLSEEEKENEIIRAITALSTVRCNHNGAIILDFCLHKMSDNAKHVLLLELSQKNQGVYWLLAAMIDGKFLDAVQDIVKCWCYEDVSVSADKILSYDDYSILISSLSNVILESPELSIQAKAIMMSLWRCDSFNEHKKAAVDISQGIVNIIPMKDTLAGLIVDWRCNDNRNATKKEEILEILQFAKDCCSVESLIGFKKNIVNSLRTSGRNGMKKNVDYGALAEELFCELEKTRSSRPQSTLGSSGISDLSSGYSK